MKIREVLTKRGAFRFFMEKITLTESEVAYILHRLSPFYVNKEIREVMHILTMHFPKEHEQEAIPTIPPDSALENI